MNENRRFARQTHDRGPNAAESRSRQARASGSASRSFNPYWRALATRGALQPKLHINDLGSTLERDADRAADLVDTTMTHESSAASPALVHHGSNAVGSLTPLVQRKGVAGSIPEDVPKGMWGQWALNMPEVQVGDMGQKEGEDFWRRTGGVTGLIQFLPSTDKAVKNSPKIGLVQVARVIDHTIGAPASLQARDPQIPVGVQTEDNKEAGVKAGVFLDQQMSRIIRGTAPLSRFYIEQGSSWMLSGEQYGSKKGEEVKFAGLHDTPHWDRDCTYEFETYAQSDKKFVTYGGVRWGFVLKMKTELEDDYDPKGNVVPTMKPATIEPLPIEPIYALSPTATDAIARFFEHIKEPEPTKGEAAPQRKALDTGAVDGSGIAPTLGDASVESGRAPDDDTRRLMEARLGHDFSRVRVHDDRQSQDAATQLNARAFTYGSQVFFGPGQYRPGTREGDRLLAHELWHVVQQGQADRLTGDASAAATTPRRSPPQET